MCTDKELEMYLKFRNHIDTLFFPKWSEECNIVGVYDDNNNEIGFICVIDGYIDAIWVEPEHRRKGYARKMVMEYISTYGMPKRLHILKNNKPGTKFWNSIFELQVLEESNIDKFYYITGLKKS